VFGLLVYGILAGHIWAPPRRSRTGHSQNCVKLLKAAWRLAACGLAPQRLVIRDIVLRDAQGTSLDRSTRSGCPMISCL
jgi:hypothetical protein